MRCHRVYVHVAWRHHHHRMYVRTYVCCTSTYLELGDEDVGDAAEHRDEIERVPRLPEVVLNQTQQKQRDAFGVRHIHFVFYK